MNLNKLFLRWIAFFGITMVFTLSGWSSCASLATNELNVTSSYSASTPDFKRLLLNDADGNCMDYTNIRGRMMMIGNQALCAMDNTVSTTQCIDPNSKADSPSNINNDGCADSNDNDGCQNNDFSGGPDSAYLGLPDYDDNATFGISTTAAAQTTSSTMAKLSLNSGDNVIFARLYWMGRMSSEDNAKTPVIGTVKLLTPTTSGSYDDVTCTRHSRTGSNYACSADVTDKVTQSGEYWVGNVKGRENSSNNFSAWSLVVVVQNDKDPFRNITIYEGFKTFSDNSIEIGVDGFLTPIDNATDLNASFYIFAGESDNGYGDYAKIRDKSGVDNLVTSSLSPNINNGTKADDRDLLNATITQNNAYAVGSLPNYTNALGIDIDTFDISALLDHNQTSTKITFTSTQDQLYVPMIAISTNIYEPKFCYDYAYSQNGRFFTEDHNGSSSIVPHVVSDDLIGGDPIITKIQLRNMEKGAVASNVMFRINIAGDANNGEFSTNKTELNTTRTTPGGLSYNAVPAGDFTNHTSSLIRYKLADSMPYDAATFTQFKINPLADSINIPMDMSIDFQIALSGIPPLQYSGFRLKDDIPICSSDNFAYNVPWGIYSPVDHDLYVATGKYNIGTQVANRPFSIDVVSFDATNINTVKSVRDYIAVEMIDAGGFHDINSTCRDPQALTSRVWIPFGNFNASGDKVSDGNITKIPVDLSKAVSRGLLTTAEKDAFFNVARENTALRVWTLVDNTGKQLNIGFNATGTVSGSNPKPDFSANSAWLTSTGCSTTCSSGTMTNGATIKACLECLYAKGAYPLCSRDNFAIRPESYNVRLADVNQTNLNGPQTIFASDRTGNTTTPNTQRVGVAADYNYKFDINATNHLSNASVPGYTRYFRGTSGFTDYNATFIWEPQVADSSGCNDTNNYPQNIKIKDGVLHTSSNSRIFPEIGDYRFNITDRAWTAVDWNDTKMVHHTGTNASYYVSGDDCLYNSNQVQQEDIGYYSGGAYKQNGCDISSTHTNQSLISASQLKYSDYNLTVMPYKFDMTSTAYGAGKNNTLINAGDTRFIYMADMSNSDDENMSLHAVGNIIAKGYNGKQLVNYVKQCYAKDMNMSMVADVNLTIPNTPYQIRWKNFNSIGSVIYDSNTTNITTDFTKIMKITDGNFTKDTNGSLPYQALLNYDRNMTNPISLQNTHFTSFSTQCATASQCKMQADLNSSYEANGTDIMDFNITYGYGRYHPTNVKVYGSSPFNELSYMEVFDAPVINGTNLTPSRFNTGWFINNQHTGTNLGEARVSVLETSGSSAASDVNSTINIGNATYPMAGQTPPYRARAHVNTEGWLWFGLGTGTYTDPAVGNSLANCNNHPCFYIDVLPVIGRAGSAEDDGGSKNNKSSNSTNELNWRSTSEYAPAIR